MIIRIIDPECNIIDIKVKFVPTVCEAKFCGIIDQSLFYRPHCAFYTRFYIDIVYRSTANFTLCPICYAKKDNSRVSECL